MEAKRAFYRLLSIDSFELSLMCALSHTLLII